jgi:hypothetical protein
MPGPPTPPARRPGTDRGVSEVVSYTLTLVVVVASVSTVLALGVPALEDAKGDQQDLNAEDAFVRVATKFGELGDRGAPFRSGQLSVAPGQLTVQDDAELTVTVATSAGDRSRTFTLRRLSYARGDTTVALEGGAVFRRDGDASTAVQRPSLRCAESGAVLTVPTLAATGTTSVGSDLVTVTGRHRNSSLWYPHNRTGTDSATDATAVTVAPDSTFGDAWVRALRAAPGWTETAPGSGRFSCDADRVHVRHIHIGVEFV